MTIDLALPLYGTIPDTVTVEGLLRDPSSEYADGTALVPEPRLLSWNPLALAHEPEDCEPGETFCSARACMESWSRDYYLRVVENGVIVWMSPDHPDAHLHN